MQRLVYTALNYHIIIIIIIANTLREKLVSLAAGNNQSKETKKRPLLYFPPLSTSPALSYEPIFHIISLHGKIWNQLIDLASNVWLHSSVSQASHRYRGGHGFESRWSPVIFQLNKLENILRWSLFAFWI